MWYLSFTSNLKPNVSILLTCLTRELSARHWQEAVGQILIYNQLTSKVSVSSRLSPAQQTTLVQSHQGHPLWLTLSSSSVINNCPYPNLLPVPSSPLTAADASAATRWRQHQANTRSALGNFSASRHKARDIICGGTEGARRTNVLKCITSLATNMIIYLKQWVRCQAREGP